MKKLLLILLVCLFNISDSKEQECIDTVANSLTVINKFNINGSNCLFTVRFCVRKTAEIANSIEYAVFYTGGVIKDSIDVTGYNVGSVICRLFTFVAVCNSNASFVAVGRDVNRSTCGAIADMISLPIRLIQFTYEKKKNGFIDLNWETASESNSSHFLIQQSIDGRNFSDVIKVPAAGESTVLKTYSVQLPNTATTAIYNYYRLQMFDKDGSYTYSPIIHIGNNASYAFEVYPNPVSNQLTVHHNKLSKENFKLFDLTGKEISISWSGESTIACENLHPGIFFLRYQDLVLRFVKN